MVDARCVSSRFAVLMHRMNDGRERALCGGSLARTRPHLHFGKKKNTCAELHRECTAPHCLVYIPAARHLCTVQCAIQRWMRTYQHTSCRERYRPRTHSSVRRCIPLRYIDRSISIVQQRRYMQVHLDTLVTRALLAWALLRY